MFSQIRQERCPPILSRTPETLDPTLVCGCPTLERGGLESRARVHHARARRKGREPRGQRSDPTPLQSPRALGFTRRSGIPRPNPSRSSNHPLTHRTEMNATAGPLADRPIPNERDCGVCSPVSRTRSGLDPGTRPPVTSTGGLRPERRFGNRRRIEKVFNVQPVDQWFQAFHESSDITVCPNHRSCK